MNEKKYHSRDSTVMMEIKDFDIAIVEALHDRLLDNHGIPLGDKGLENARGLISRMYSAFKVKNSNE